MRDDVTAAMSAANAAEGPRTVPGRVIPVPSTVSPQLREAVAAPYRVPQWNLAPDGPAQWRAEATRLAAPTVDALPALREYFDVTSAPATFGGVPGWWLRPAGATAAHRPVLLHLHGGGYVYTPGEAGTFEAVVMAGIGGFDVASIDYRMAYDAPFPAALDDVVAAWRDLTARRRASDVGVFGTSVGGALTLSLVLRAAADGFAAPGAIGVGTPWSDLTETGDSYRTNEWLDSVEVSYRGFLSRAAALYADGHDLTDPLLSPVYGDFTGAPPAVLLSGTRDLFLSNTVRVHRALRAAGVVAELHVFEAQSHAQYLRPYTSPETRDAYGEMAGFLRKHLTRADTR